MNLRRSTGFRVAVFALTGTLFGFGLALGGMTDPARVRAFLDVLGAWDPTLLFVLLGAAATMSVAWLIQARMHVPIAADRFSLPTRKDITARLLGGAAIFGVGWGMTGLCPGPAVAALTAEPAQALIFVAAMIAGMALMRFFPER